MLSFCATSLIHYKCLAWRFHMIAIKPLSFAYTRNNPLFKELNLAVDKGGICGLLGKNGSGKTTLLKILVGLIFPNKGCCQVLGQIPLQRCPSFLNDIYFLPEDLYVPALTAEEYRRFYSPFYSRFDHQLWQNCLNEFDLPHSKSLLHFSHGQKKKFLIAF